MCVPDGFQSQLRARIFATQKIMHLCCMILRFNIILISGLLRAFSYSLPRNISLSAAVLPCEPCIIITTRMLIGNALFVFAARAESFWHGDGKIEVDLMNDKIIIADDF